MALILASLFTVTATLFIDRLDLHFHLRSALRHSANGIVQPATVDEITTLLALHPKVSLRGAGRSMGGQTSHPTAVQLDLHRLNRILHFDPVKKTIEVEAGCYWADILAYINPYGLSLGAMQSYCDFSVGGSIGVNCHGQSLDANPVIYSLLALKLILPNGRQRLLTPTDNLFKYVVGGYGLVGVVVSATFQLIDNVRLVKIPQTVAITQYVDHLTGLRQLNQSILHSARLDLTTSLDSRIYPTANFVLQEYFCPPESLVMFIASMRRIITQYRVNVVNITLRYVRAHSTVLSYSPRDSVALVLYLDLNKYEPLSVAMMWTQALIQAVIEVGGSYYLPYQIWARKDQVATCYPGIEKLLRLKKKLDPEEKLVSELWEFMR